jgi:hypothetical protein
MMRFGKVEALKAEGVHPRAWLSFDDHKKFPQHRERPADSRSHGVHLGMVMFRYRMTWL